MSESLSPSLKRSLALEGMSAEAVKSLAEFIRRYYFVSNLKYLAGPIQLRQVQSPDEGYAFTFGATLGNSPVSMRFVITQLNAEVTGYCAGPVTDGMREEFEILSDGIELVVRTFLASARRGKAYFVFSTADGRGMDSPATNSERPGRALLRRLMHGNAMNLFLFFLLLSFMFVVLIGDYALLAIIVFQSIALFFSDRLAMAIGNLHPSRSEPDITIVSVQLTPETSKLVRKRGGRTVSVMREELHAAVAKGTSEVELKPVIQRIFAAHGFAISENETQITTRHVFPIVERASAKFNLCTPKIVISNTRADNASAMGISPRRSTITITAGALEDLNDDELESVIGHELGHIKGRDPLILFALTSLMYLGGFYLWVPLLLFLGLFYFIFAFGIVFLVGKFLETRADTESSNFVGMPQMLATALTNIGFRQLYYERYSTSIRVLDWLRFDPHPPTYFRVQRLYRISSRGEKVHHTLYASARDCVIGFFQALSGL